MGVADPGLHHGPVTLPSDPTGIEEPHDVLAAEEFAMPAPRSGWHAPLQAPRPSLARASRRGRRRGVHRRAPPGAETSHLSRVSSLTRHTIRATFRGDASNCGYRCS